jgi:hypothetical protein
MQAQPGERSPGIRVLGAKAPEFTPSRNIRFETQTVKTGKSRRQKRRPAPDDDPDKPPRVEPHTYWTRKGGGWVLEFKRKLKHKWLYEYYGSLKLETWNQLKGRYQDEKLKDVIRGIIGAKRAELQRARDSRSGGHRLRLVGEC